MNNERELSLSVKFTLKTVLFVIGNNNKNVDDQTEKADHKHLVVEANLG